MSGVVPQAASPAVTALVHIMAPAGRLGVVIDVSPGGGPSCIIKVKATSPLRGEICLGDRIIAVDDEDVQWRTPTEVSTLLREKQANKTRKITVFRDVSPGGWRGKVLRPHNPPYMHNAMMHTYSLDVMLNPVFTISSVTTTI